ncbi:MAG: MATE family efflux transporter [Lachnospiraceae bacterium]|nr:MATE family efflux transporter [Lachnospiraceae bacterium]
MIGKIFDPSISTVQTEDQTVSLKGLFIPFFIEHLLMNLMGTVNTLVLGHYSDDAVAAVGAANQVIGFVFTFYAVVSGGVSIVISHRLGAGESDRAEDAVFSALVFGGLLSIVCSLALSFWAFPIMKLLNLEDHVLQMAVNYFRICIRFSFFQGIMSVISAVMRSYGHPKPAVFASLVMNAINAAMNYVVVFRPFETPFEGAEGIAVSNVAAHLIALVLLCTLFVTSGIPFHIRTKSVRSLLAMRQIIHVGIPGGISNLSYSFSQVVSTGILAALGTIALSTKIYVASIVFYVYVVSLSLGMSTSILVGWMVGAKEYDRAYRLNQMVMRFSLLVNGSLSILLYIFHEPLLSLFTSNPEILAMAKGILLIDIFVEIGRAMNHIECNSLQGAGDVMFPMVVSILSCWVMSIGLSYVFGILLHMGLYGCWLAFMVDELFRGTLFFLRFKSKRWMRAKI